MYVGTIQSVWRYPVKSMLGEQLTAATLAPLGIPGDRGYAIRDERAGEIRGAKKIPALLRFSARYLAEPSDTSVPPAEITCPDGTTVRTDDPHVHSRLSHALGQEVTLWSRQPADDTQHYRRHPRAMEEIREILGLEAGDPFPSFEGLPQDIFQYVSPLGTYFDAYPLHLLTTASLRTFATCYPAGRFVPQRFRPNLVIATPADGTPEVTWQGKILRVGTAVLSIQVPTIRCVMTTLPQGDLPKDPRILRTVVQHYSHHAGVYATVTQPGVVRVGDAVEVLA